MKSVFAVALCAGFCFLTTCTNYPLYTGDRDIVEFESVWQYLKVYSIYQDRVPSDRFAFSTPESLLLAVHDTLKSVNYTRYDTLRGLARHAAVSGTTGDVDAVRLTDSTAIVSISEFTAGTYAEFKEKISTVSTCLNIIVDLRSNPGGDLNALDSIIAVLLPAGTPYIDSRYREYDAEKVRATTVEWAPRRVKNSIGKPLVNKKFAVLINGGTASAAEILAAGLKDAAGALLLGSRTYGKGMGQIKVPRRDRDTLQITYLQLRGLTARTGDYHRHGITPDTVPQSVIQSGGIYIDPDVKTVWYALKMLEPSATRLPVLVKSLSAVAGRALGYVVSEPDPLISQK